MTALACQMRGVAASGPGNSPPYPHPRRYPDARQRLRRHDVTTCPECLALDPDRPGLAVRVALRVLGKVEADDDLAAKAFEEAGIDVTAVLYDRGDPLGGRGSRGPQRKAFHHVGREGKAALRAGYARLLDLRVHAASDHGPPVPPTAPPSGRPGVCCVGSGGRRRGGWC